MKQQQFSFQSADRFLRRILAVEAKLDFKISKYLRKSLKYKTRYGRIVAI
ncbi:MAG: hypothetical protein MR871_07550 [Lachnospiraceae bacterium]|nr:hypothetical protein [Lachnospiraceae bacterium]MDD7077552.1 hypothetical protein [Lachnospiraceae bacterium]MDY3730240.1 hypothetical protein [Candidatus Choladocola sp.]